MDWKQNSKLKKNEAIYIYIYIYIYYIYIYIYIYKLIIKDSYLTIYYFNKVVSSPITAAPTLQLSFCAHSLRARPTLFFRISYLGLRFTVGSSLFTHQLRITGLYENAYYL